MSSNLQQEGIKSRECVKTFPNFEVKRDSTKWNKHKEDKHHSECKIWRCGSTIIPVRFMTNHHILNTIKHIQDSTETHFVGQLRQNWLSTLYAEKKHRERLTAIVMKKFKSIRHLVD